MVDTTAHDRHILLKDTDSKRVFRYKNFQGHRFVKASFDDVHDMVKELMTHNSGPKPLHVSCCEGVPTDTLTLILLIVCTDSLSKPMSKLTLSGRFSEYLLQEINYSTLASVNPDYLKAIHNNFHTHRARRTIEESISNGMFGDPDELGLIDWASDTQHKVGMIFIQGMVNRGYIINLNDLNSNGAYVYWSPEVLDWVKDVYDRSLYLFPSYTPLLSPPDPYKVTTGGVYNHSYGENMAPIRFRISGSNTLNNGSTLHAANELGQVAYKVEPSIFNIVRNLWEQGHEVGKLPASQPKELPEWLPDDSPEPMLKERNKRAHKVHLENAFTKGRRIYMHRQMSIMSTLVDKPIYFVWSADSRGRLYPTTSMFLSPQGHDLSKGLLRFNESKPLGKSGLRQLYIHTAECYGVDKVSLEDRYQWTQDNMNIIRDVASSPVSSLELWRYTDSPFQFLSACIELVAALDSEIPTEYPSNLIKHYDGKCSGVQHWSALLRDRTTGTHVGLTSSAPDSVPSDLYTHILFGLYEKLRSDEDEYSQWWLNQGLDRAAVKRPTMTYVYGSTLTAWSNHLKEWCKERGIEGERTVPSNYTEGEYTSDLYLRTMHLAKLLSSVYTKNLSSCVKGMRWVKSAAGVITKAGANTITWSSPTGFQVQQSYRKTKTKILEVSSKAIGTKLRLSQVVETDEPSPTKQANSLPPNYIHSMDAAHLVDVVTKYPHQLVTIHDSFGTHLSDGEELLHLLKTSFSNQYSRDNLSELKSYWEKKYRVVLPDLPAAGDLNVDEVMSSSYLFS